MDTLLDAIIKNDYFRQRVSLHLNLLIHKRLNRPAPPKGRDYLRDWYDRMTHNEILTTDFFIKHIQDIWIKKSNLNREERLIIELVCNKAYNDLLLYLEDKEKQDTQIIEID